MAASRVLLDDAARLSSLDLHTHGEELDWRRGTALFYGAVERASMLLLRCNASWNNPLWC